MKKKTKVKRSNSSVGKIGNKRLQKAEVKAVKKTIKFGPSSKKAKKANEKVVKITKKKY